MEDVALTHPPHCHHHHRPSSSSLQHQHITMPPSSVSESMYGSNGNSDMYAYAYGHASSQHPPLSSSSTSRVPSPTQNNSSTPGIVSDQGIHAYNATSTQTSAESGDTTSSLAPPVSVDNNNDASLPSSPSTTKSLSSTSPSWQQQQHLDKAPKHLDTVAFDTANQVQPSSLDWSL